MADTAKKLRKTRGKRNPNDENLPAGHSRHTIVYPDDVWNRLEEICRKHPLEPSPTKYLNLILKVSIEKDEKELGIH